MADNKNMHFLAGSVVDARILSDAERKKLGIEDARKGHYGIFHPVTGALMNTMDPEQFAQHYHAADSLAAKPTPAKKAPAAPAAAAPADEPEPTGDDAPPATEGDSDPA